MFSHSTSAVLAPTNKAAFVLRTRGMFFIMVTLAFAQIFYFVFHDVKALGGSTDGINLRGKPDAAALRDHGLDLVTRPAPQPEDAEALLARFAAISLPAAPYAHSLDPTAPLTLALLAGDPVQDEPRPRAILSESEWEALRDICKPR